jgi:cell division protein FtsI (penicillin-binding protein 3)
VLKDLRGRTVRELQLIRSARPGQNMALSIDLRLQYLAHRELRAAVQAHGAKAGSLVVLDVQTGEVLAMANQPSYNPNDRTHLSGASLRNRALTDLFEPGCTMKPLAVMAALESGKFSPRTQIDTAPGHVRVGSHIRYDPTNFGRIDLATVVAKSSQVGMVKMALEMDPEAVRGMYYRMGLGQAPGTGFPGEGVGSLPTYARWQPIQRATYSFGYGMNVTLTQLTQAYAVIASGGLKRPVSLLRLDDVPAAERVVDADIVRHIKAILEQAVSNDGTGSRARTDSYAVAGKTGTVHKVGASGYDDHRYMASFAGFAPADKPRIVVAVVIDEPGETQYFGGLVAAPVFSRVAEGALRLLQVPPQQTPANMVERRRSGRPVS